MVDVKECDVVGFKLVSISVVADPIGSVTVLGESTTIVVNVGF